MKIHRLFCLLVALVFFGTIHCSTKDKNPVESSVPMVPGKHLVHIRNYSDVMWVGTNSDSLGSVMQNLVGTKKKYWIGGGVVPDESCPHGFYFAPNTIVIAEITAEGMQTTIQQIAQDPQYYASNGWSNGLADHAWYVLALFLEYRTG